MLNVLACALCPCFCASLVLLAVMVLTRYKYNKQKYKLRVTLFHCNKSFWSHVRSIDDIVVPTEIWEDESSDLAWGSKFILFNSSKTQRQIQFLTSCVDELVNSDLSSRSTKWRTGLLYNLKKITKRKMYVDKCRLDKQIECVQSSLTSSLNEAIDALSVQLPRYFVVLKSVKDNPAPITDLSNFTKNGSLHVPKFVSAFNAQVRTNFANLQQLEDTCSQLLPNLNAVVSIIGDSNELHLGLSWDKKKLEKVLNYVIQIKDNLLEFLGYLDSHCKFVSTTQSKIPMEYFRHVKVLTFLSTHKERFRQLYESSGNVIAFPTSAPNVLTLSDEPIILRNTDDFRKAKASYDQLEEMATCMKKAIPTKFPVPVHNLSTFNGEPKIEISCEEDFLLILSSYAEYQRQLENMRKNFTYELKTIVNAIVKIGHTEIETGTQFNETMWTD